jgi:MFS family permease
MVVEPNSPASRAGVRTGDLLTMNGRLIDQAAALFAPPGRTITFELNGRRVVHLTSRPAPVDPLNQAWLDAVTRLAFLLVALLLAWRRPDDRAVRALTVFLVCLGLIIGLSDTLLPTPLLSFLAVNMISLIFALCTVAAAAVFGSLFPSGTAQPVPRIIANVSVALAGAGSLLIVIGTVYANTPELLSNLSLAAIGVFFLIGALFIATLVISYVRGAPSERQRRRWVFLVLGVGLAAGMLDLLVQETIGYVPAIAYATFTLIAAIPFGLAYVILRHRVIDVGFVLNRAVVYAGVSIVIVGIFTIVETLLAKYVENTSHVTSMAVQLAVALGLGFSIRYVHARVDHFVDTVLFRERHLAEQAIRNFAHDATYITDESVLTARCITVLERYAGAHGAGIWVADGAAYRPAASTFGTAPTVTENDSAVVAMRARRVSVHVRDCDSQLPGSLALPMIVRGELLGILVCGPKAADEDYAPDEESALASLATSVGHALDAIEVRELRRRLEALTATGGVQPAF